MALLEALTRTGAVTGTDVIELAGPSSPPVPSLDETIAERVADLRGDDLDVARAVAVLGPSEPERVASLLEVSPIALLGPVQRLVTAGLLEERGDLLRFVHDAYRTAVYEATPGALRRLLHTAAARQLPAPDRPRHLIASASAAGVVLDAVHDTGVELDAAPGVTADLLAAAARLPDPDRRAATLAVTRARALARSGQMARAAAVAGDAVARTDDPAVLSELRRVQIFALSTGARVGAALDLVRATLADPLPERARQVLTEHRDLLTLLGGRDPVPADPVGAALGAVTVNGQVAEALGLGLVLSPINTDALSRVTAAQRPQASGLVQTVRQLGGTLGVAVIGSVILARQSPHPAPGRVVQDTAHAMTAGFWVAVAVFAAGLLAGSTLLPRRARRAARRTGSSAALAG
ncbi:hypothetical protein [Frankia sp. AiPs1]|uniref:hypothetical protein n=1 Tax=Frankia sp. AiPs1 TaxID=573493 RepID=UPI00204443BA|nr:hypothetical protein [Frankia sp. AiPs1]